MMYRSVLIFLCAALVSCSSDSSKTASNKKSEPWTMEFNHLKKVEDNCQKDECTYIELSIPVVKGGSVEARSQINDYIDGRFRESLKSRLPEPNSTAPFADLAASFLEGYKLFNMEFPDNDASWFVELKGDSSILSDTYFTAMLHEYDYMGGAHPNSFSTIQSFDLENGNKIDVLSMYDSLSMVQLAESAFRIIHGVPDTLNLNDAGMMFEKGEFALPENLGLTPDGILFHYNTYEVAPYAIGPTSFIIPYEDLGEES